MTFREIDVIRSGGLFDNPTISLQPAEDMPMYDLRFEDIRINGEGKSNLIEVYPHFERWSKKKTPGSIRNVYFRDIVVHSVSPQGRLGRIHVEGPHAGHTVENVTFDNVVRYGLSTRADSPEVEVKGRVHNVTFKPRAFETPDAGGASKNPQKEGRHHEQTQSDVDRVGCAWGHGSGRGSRGPRRSGLVLRHNCR